MIELFAWIITIYILQLIVCLSGLIIGGFKTKRTFLFSLIPILPIFKILIDEFNKLN